MSSRKIWTDIWMDMFKKVNEYIHQYNQKPPENSPNKDYKKMAAWLYTQKNNYNKKRYKMQNPEFRDKWDEFIDKYKDIFSSW
jgi:hypothetical protein